jgi:DNA-binding protein H-NS/nucleoside phosphorylase
LKRALIFTAKDTETAAVKAYLEEKPCGFERTKRGNKVTIWRPIDALSFNTPFEIALYETGKGQAEAIMNAGPVVEAVAPDLVIYLGCAGGEAAYVDIGDVLVATKVWNYEQASIKERSVRYKGVPQLPDRVLVDEAKSVADFGSWKSKIIEGSPNSAHAVFGEIASGDKVIKSTKSPVWKKLKSGLSDDIIGCETEGHGFLSAMVPLKTFSIMIRGISDLIENKGSEGKSNDDNQQKISVSHAMAFALQVIDDIDETCLRRVVSEDSEGDEILALRLEAKRSDLVEIIGRLSEISLSIEMKVKSVDSGSLLLTVAMSRESVAFSNALYDGKKLSKLLGFEVTGLVPSTTTTGEPHFDAWLKEVRSGKLKGKASRMLEKANPRWYAHSRYVSKELTKINRERSKFRSEPKYAKPGDPSMTWSGKGRQPHWVKEHLASGGSINDLAIEGTPRKRVRRSSIPSEPKYANPENPSQTWTGRGRQPGWVRELLASGKRLEDLEI